MASFTIFGGNATTEQSVFRVCPSRAVPQRPEGPLAGEILRWKESEAQGIILYVHTCKNKFAWCFEIQRVSLLSYLLRMYRYLPAYLRYGVYQLSIHAAVRTPLFTYAPHPFCVHTVTCLPIVL